jgi:hypothetical protein
MFYMSTKKVFHTLTKKHGISAHVVLVLESIKLKRSLLKLRSSTAMLSNTTWNSTTKNIASNIPKPIKKLRKASKLLQKLT